MTYHEEVKQFPLHFPGNFFGRAIIGWGAVKMTGEMCKQAGIKNALLVTTGLSGTGIVDEVQGICNYAGVKTNIFKVAQTNPRIEDAEKGVKAFKEAEADGILTVGGGTSHDCGKLIRGRLANPDKAWSELIAVIDPHFIQTFIKLNPVTIPQVSVNTTAGTGAEISGMAIVNDMQKHWKVCVLVPKNTPWVGISDPAVMRCMPEHLAAATGLDAVEHKHSNALFPMLIRRYDYGTSEAILCLRHRDRRKSLYFPPLHSIFYGFICLAIIFQHSFLIFPALGALSLDFLRKRTKIKKTGLTLGGMKVFGSLLRTYFSFAYFTSSYLVRYYLIFLIPISYYYTKAWGFTLSLLIFSALFDFCLKKPKINVFSFLFFYTLDQLAYQLGVFGGCIRNLTFKPYIPVIVKDSKR